MRRPKPFSRCLFWEKNQDETNETVELFFSDAEEMAGMGESRERFQPSLAEISERMGGKQRKQTRWSQIPLSQEGGYGGFGGRHGEEICRK
jgi:hypothetical protein